jgi:hypothetical protein
MVRSPVDADLQRPAKSGDLAVEVFRDLQRLVGPGDRTRKQENKDLALANAIATGMVVSGGLLVILDVLVAV